MSTYFYFFIFINISTSSTGFSCALIKLAQSKVQTNKGTSFCNLFIFFLFIFLDLIQVLVTKREREKRNFFFFFPFLSNRRMPFFKPLQFRLFLRPKIERLHHQYNKLEIEIQIHLIFLLNLSFDVFLVNESYRQDVQLEYEHD